MTLVIPEAEVRSALEAVIDPELHRSIVELDMVCSIDISANGVVDVTVSVAIQFSCRCSSGSGAIPVHRNRHVIPSPNESTAALRVDAEDVLRICPGARYPAEVE
jgi:hypothetical protein